MKKLILILLALPLFAFSPKEIGEQVNAGNYKRAEEMTRQTIKERPESAKAHYFLGQILSREAKYQESYNELQKAMALDKSLSFALTNEKFQEELRKVEVNLGKLSAPKVDEAANKEDTRKEILWTVLFVGGSFAVIFIVLSLQDRSDKKKAAEYQKTRVREQTVRIMGIMDKIDELEAKFKLSEDANKDEKLRKLAEIKSELTQKLRASKSGEIVSVVGFERDLYDLEYPSKKRNTYNNSTGYGAILSGQPQAQNQLNQAAAYNNTNSQSGVQHNDGFLNGIILGNLMGGHSGTTVNNYVEERRESPAKSDSIFDSGSDDRKSDSFDSSSDSSFDSGSSSSFDSGSSSSFDSGSDSSSW